MLRLIVRVTPKAACDRVDGPASDASGRTYLKLRVRAAPEAGAANTAACALVADWLNLPKSAVRLVTGAQSRVKALAIEADARAEAQIREMFGDDG